MENRAKISDLYKEMERATNRRDFLSNWICAQFQGKEWGLVGSLMLTPPDPDALGLIERLLEDNRLFSEFMELLKEGLGAEISPAATQIAEDDRAILEALKANLEKRRETDERD